ncbi:TPA: phage major capsid protein [Pseudomonas aeruginosa]|nr:phage major capsid protein [Pseudomonas aeruginosa]
MTKPTTPPTTTSAPLPVLRTLQSAPVMRALGVDLSTLDQEKRTVEIAVSSEYPVRQWFGMEVLDHTDAAIDLERMRSGAPVLIQHERHSAWSQVGVVEEVWLAADRKLRARIRFSKGDEGSRIFNDIADGIRQNVSVGYIPLEMVLERSENGLDHYRVTRWQPFEVSVVSVPADPSVGVGRSQAETTHTVIVRGSTMPQENTPAEPTTVTTDPLVAERSRVADIIALGDRFGQRDLATEAVGKGHSVDQFRALLLERQAPAAPKPVAISAPKDGERDLPGFAKDVSARSLGLTDKEIGEYSLMRAMNAYAEKDWSKAGLEREVNIALGDTLKKEARGFYVPHDLLMAGYRAGMSKGEVGKGGELVATELRISEFVDILRNKTVMARLGMRLLGGLVGDLDLPKKVSGSNFYWLGEGQNVPDSSFDLSTVPLSPKTIGGAIPVTRRLRKQASKSIEALIISDLIDGLGVAIDLAMLTGTGADNMPLGLLNAAGIPAISYLATGIDFDAVVEMETKAATFNVEGDSLAYLTSPTQRGAAKRKQVFDATGERVWTRDNEVNGYKATASNQVPANTWVYGDFSQIICGMWGVLDLKPDPYALAGSDGLMLRVFQDVDAAIRRTESFVIAKKAAA